MVAICFTNNGGSYLLSFQKMTNTTKALIFVLAIYLVMFIAQQSMDVVAETYGLTKVNFKNPGNTIIDGLNMGNYTLNVTAYEDDLPGVEGVSAGEGNIFTDTVSSIREWFNTIGGFVKSLLLGPYNFLMMANLPQEFVFAISSFWYSVSLFLLVSFFWGRE